MTGRTKFSSRIARWTRTFSYYDLVLLLVPLPFLVGLFAGITLSVPLRVGVTTAGVVSALLVADAVFRNPPINGQSA
ncbi:hypothetical protein [Halomicrococcus sp. NG-SE-24]|uniref:hypothetical protein n=1 Tax=unclassified Halomicrococcus TaxID=2614448 RepID=UPI003D95EECF